MLVILAATALAAAPDCPPLPEPAVVLLDDRRSDADRAAAAAALARAGDADALPVLRAASRDRRPAVQEAAVTAAAAFADAEAVALVADVAADRQARLATRLLAVETLGVIGQPDAAASLWRLAGDRRVAARVRARAARELEGRYPDALAELGEPRAVSEPLGAAVGVAANGVVAGVALSSVGAWGRFDAAPAIGAVGGGAIGASTAGLYAATVPVTTGQGLAYASGVGWGVAYGGLGARAILGPAAYGDDAARERHARLDPLFRLVGTVAGASVGAAAVAADPRPLDVVEVDLAGYLGSAVALSIADVAAWHPPPAPRASPDGPAPRDTAYWNAWNLRTRRLRAGVTLSGASAGLGAGVALHRQWSLDAHDAFFAAVVGAEAAWVGAYAPAAAGIDDDALKGTVRLPLHAAAIGALAIAEARPVPWEASALGLFGAVAGNALGYGAPLLVGATDEASIARVMIPIGVAGTAGGVAAAPWLDPGLGQWTTAAVGVPIATANAVIVGDRLRAAGALSRDQVGGLALTTASIAGVGAVAVGPWADPRPADVLVVGSAAAWGAWYGVLVPMAAAPDLAAEDVRLVGVLTADAFAAGGAAALIAGLEPGRTLPAQMGGLLGATAGGLGAAMASGAGRDVALGALVGTTAGMLAGGALTGRVGDAPAWTFRPPRLPGRWTAAVWPTPGADGELGAHARVAVTGW